MPAIENAILKEIWESLEDEGTFDVDDLKEERECLFGARQKKDSNNRFKWNWNGDFDSKSESGSSAKSESKDNYARNSIDYLVLSAYREVAKKWHPDLCKGSSEPMKAINDFYERLKTGLSKL